MANKLADHLDFQKKFLGKVMIKNVRFTVITKCNSPALMLQLGFLTNPKERTYLGSIKGQTEIANMIL
ncbi:N-acetylmuramoyl-L-alanine amidase [Mesonia aestuariivivens]|uniref:N-acetylmuramoyl-L-alanine amidase n=1 Tax=Mesonia aestuariivivens TaxID=2796128 RepID=A0ABS6W1Q5_9FLAO|nr:N-acetylmuramoyl-L-alanine amidase [Mesonia aestuariivivens]MBW2961093.1 N-acetylmuramoyl-L-alanine amidase [Mesonia aestuariivivens]